jgi:hypothetical protein
MKTRSFLIQIVSVVTIAGLSFLVSCSADEPQFSQEAAYAAEESKIDAYYADADDMAGVAVAESAETEGGKMSEGARILEINDDRFCGVTVELDPDLPQLPSLPIGNITINFGESCEDPYGNIRRGKIKIHFEGRKFRVGSYTSIYFENYEINGIKLNGVRTLTNLQGSTIDKPKSQIELENGSVEWDGNVATREHCFVSTWDRGIVLAPGDDVLKIGQCSDAAVAAEGVNRDGVHYKVFIEEELAYKRGCPMAVSGVKKFVEVNTGKEIVIDYGNGTCDADISITVNGNIHNIRTRR